MTFNIVLRFFDLRYKVSLMWDSSPRPSDFRSDALPTELVITIYVYIYIHMYICTYMTLIIMIIIRFLDFKF